VVSTNLEIAPYPRGLHFSRQLNFAILKRRYFAKLKGPFIFYEVGGAGGIWGGHGHVKKMALKGGPSKKKGKGGSREIFL